MLTEEERKKTQAEKIMTTLNGKIMDGGLVIKLPGKDPVVIKSSSEQVTDKSLRPGVTEVKHGGCWVHIKFTCGTLRTTDLDALMCWVEKPVHFGGEDRRFSKMYGPANVSFSVVFGAFTCGADEDTGQKKGPFVPRAQSRSRLYA
jgi:hypothetical protein